MDIKKLTELIREKPVQRAVLTSFTGRGNPKFRLQGDSLTIIADPPYRDNSKTPYGSICSIVDQEMSMIPEEERTFDIRITRFVDSNGEIPAAYGHLLPGKNPILSAGSLGDFQGEYIDTLIIGFGDKDGAPIVRPIYLYNRIFVLPPTKNLRASNQDEFDLEQSFYYNTMQRYRGHLSEMEAVCKN